MPQVELDPQQPIVPVGEKSILALPAHVRRFGYVPDLSACMPGDLILFRSHDPNLTGQLIAAAQLAGGISPEHSRWTHAAIFLTDDFVVEASPITGVAQRTLYLDIPSKVLRVRRHPKLTEIERYRLALRALRMLGSPYGYGTAIAAAWRLLNGLWSVPAINTLGPEVVCSKVFSDAYSDVTQKLLTNCPIDVPVTPAHLSATPDLDDIQIGWLSLI